MPNWCIPPVRWMQAWLIPPKGIEDWQRIAFQPMLYTCMWIGAVLHLTVGDVTAIERDDAPAGVYQAWMSLSLLTPPMALAALVLIVHTTGPDTLHKLPGRWVWMNAERTQLYGQWEQWGGMRVSNSYFTHHIKRPSLRPRHTQTADKRPRHQADLFLMPDEA